MMSNSLWAHGPPHTRLLCPLPSPWASSNSCPLRRWCHQTISSSVIPFSSCLQSFPESRHFPMSRFFPSGGQRIGASTSASYKFGEILVCIYKKNLKPVYHFRENGHCQSAESCNPWTRLSPVYLDLLWFLFSTFCIFQHIPTPIPAWPHLN